jgi:hypothetical protein
MKEEPDDFVYVGRLKPCGCAVAVCLDIPGCADDVRDMIATGYTVERMAGEMFRTTVRLECLHHKRVTITSVP